MANLIFALRGAVLWNIEESCKCLTLRKIKQALKKAIFSSYQVLSFQIFSPVPQFLSESSLCVCIFFLFCLFFLHC